MDLTTELVNMITAQRAFQANAQAITTANQLSANRHQHQPLTGHEAQIMDRGLYVAMTGAKQIMQAQAVNNHNIANFSTIGFRADAVAFDSEPIYGPGYATRVNAVAGDAGTDFSSGVMQSTGPRSRHRGQRQGIHRGARHRRQGSLHPRRRFARHADGAVTTASGLAGADASPGRW